MPKFNFLSLQHTRCWTQGWNPDREWAFAGAGPIWGKTDARRQLEFLLFSRDFPPLYALAVALALLREALTLSRNRGQVGNLRRIANPPSFVGQPILAASSPAHRPVSAARDVPGKDRERDICHGLSAQTQADRSSKSPQRSNTQPSPCAARQRRLPYY